MNKLLLIFGAGAAFLAVVLGAFAAHALRSKLPQQLLDAFNTAVQYQMYHALALLLVGLLLQLHPGAHLLKWSGGLFAAGILLFSGSLYLVTLTPLKIFGPVTPVGGVSLMLGWLILVVALTKIA